MAHERPAASADEKKSRTQLLQELADLRSRLTAAEREGAATAKAQEALRKSEQRWATTLASIGDAVIATDPAGRVTFLNPVAESLTGWSLAEASGLAVEKVFPILDEETRGEVNNPVAKVLESGKVIGLANHTVLVRRDGVEVPIDDSGAPIADETGRITGVVLVFRDITERKQAEKALQESEARFSAILEQLPVGVGVVDRDGNYSLQNSLLKHWVPHTIPSRDPQRQSRWKPLDAFGQPLPREQWAAARALRGEEVPGLESLYLNDEGQWEWALISSAPFRSSEGTILGAITVIQDISERRRREEQLHWQNALLEYAPVLVRNLRDEIILWNRGMEALYGYTQEQALGRVPHDLLHTVHPQPVTEIRAILEREGRWLGELHHRRRDGSTVIVSSLQLLHTDASGKPEAIIEVNTDITVRKQAEAALWESEQRFILLFTKAPVPMAMSRMQDGTQVDVNEQWEKAFGYTRQEVIGKTTADLGINRDLAGRTRTLAEVNQHVSVRDREIPLFTRSGEKRIFSNNIETITISGSSYLLSTATDITERKRAEEALKKLNDTLEQQVAERTLVAESRARQLQALALQLTEVEEKERRRISDLLHEDVQQLLTASRFQLSAIRRTVEGNSSVELRLQQVDRLLEESIEKARRLSHDLSPAILHQAGLLAGVEWLARRMKENHGLEVRVNGTLFQPLSNDALNTLLYRAIQELLLNVSKHAGVREAWVQLRSAADHAEVEVSDKGRGFDPQSIGTTFHGRGFGLFGLRERLQYLGGSFSIESAPGEGCRVALAVPLKELQETEQAGETGADAGTPGASN